MQGHVNTLLEDLGTPRTVSSCPLGLYISAPRESPEAHRPERTGGTTTRESVIYRIEVMDQPNQWHPQQEEPVDELAYVYHQEEQPRMFAHPPPEQPPRYYASPPPAMAPPLPNPFHPPSRSRSFGGPSFGEMTVKTEPGQPSSSTSILSFGAQPPRTLSFSAGDWPDGIEAVQQAPERRSRAHLNTQEHVIAERRRREKMQQQFVALATIVPDLTKTDKISILGSTIKYVKQLEEKVKALEEQSAPRTSEPAVFERKCRISSDNDDAGTSSGAISGYIPNVEASIHGDTVLLKICCKERRGVLVMVFSELENHGLTIINTSALPYTDSCLSVTVTAKIEQGFSTIDELINNLSTALRRFT